MNDKTLGFVGAGLLIVGLFVPIATVPFLGSVTMMSNGFSIVAIGLLILGLLSVYLNWSERREALVWTGGAALVTVIYLFGRFEWSMSQMRASMTKDLAGNPFAGLAQTAMASVGLQWGWLILAAGPTVLLYVAVQERKREGLSLFATGDGLERIAAVISVVALVIAPIQDAWSHFNVPKEGASQAAVTPIVDATQSEATSTPSAEETTYINNSLRLYAFQAKYYDSVLDGRVPGVDFKIKNEGNRTINSLTVKVEFMDADNKPIAEELYYPVNAGGISIGGEDKPLRPNYIWQQESDQFYEAKSVPSEWKEGNARATITDIDFAPGAS